MHLRDHSSDMNERYAQPNTACDPLQALSILVPWEDFRRPLDKVMKQYAGTLGCGPPHDVVLMFKIMVLQAIYELPDDQVELEIRERHSFKRFLGQGPCERVLDAKSIWLFRGNLTHANVIEQLLLRLTNYLADDSYVIGGQFVYFSVEPGAPPLPSWRSCQDTREARLGDDSRYLCAETGRRR